jgi:hypothetical protein
MFNQENQSLATQPQNNLTTKSDVGAALATRQAQEVQAAVVMAKRFPRDWVEVERKLIQSCKRPKLAEIAIYEYPRGGTKVTGPSIRLAEAAAQAMGNIDFGWMEIQRLEDESICTAYAWDIENNIRRTTTFSVPHYRDTKQGKKRLLDDRDIYEMCANQASRRMRGCILQVVPGDLVDLALSECEKTLQANLGTVQEQAAKWGKLFEKEYAVKPESIVKYLGSRPETWTQNDIFRLRKLYNALQDNMTTVEEAFPEMAAKPLTKEQKAELLKLAKGKQEEATKILNGMGFAGINDVKDVDFETVKEAFGGLNNEG